MQKFKIIKTGKETEIEFTLNDGSKLTQTIADLPIGDKKSFITEVERYATAYENGLKIENEACEEVKAMEGTEIPIKEVEVKEMKITVMEKDIIRK